MSPLEYFATLVRRPTTARTPADRGRAVARAGRRSASRPRDAPVRHRSPRGDAKARLPDDAGQVHKLRLLNRYFFRELGFAGNANDYYDPDNSYLRSVLQAPPRHSDLARGAADGDRPAGRPAGARRVVPRSFPRQAERARGRPVSRSDDRRIAVARAARGAARGVPRSVAVGCCRRRVGRVRPDARTFKLALLQASARRRPRDPRADAAQPEGHLPRTERLARLLAVQQRLVVLLPDTHEEVRDRGLVVRAARISARRARRPERYLEKVPDAPEAARSVARSTCCGSDRRRRATDRGTRHGGPGLRRDDVRSAAMRIAPSRRIISPLSIAFVEDLL